MPKAIGCRLDFFISYGAIYFSSVALNCQNNDDWEKAIAIYSPTSISSLLPRCLLGSLFFVTSFPALIIGLGMLCSYSIRVIRFEDDHNKQYVAIFLAVLGFSYQVIGAWPLQHQIDFPWHGKTNCQLLSDFRLDALSFESYHIW